MYLTPLKTAIVEALTGTFNSTYPEADFRGVNVGIEYPVKQSNYPGLWINYEDTDALHVAGIGHKEYTVDSTTHNFIEVTRWRFTGTITITVVALSSLEKDRLYDEVVRTFAFGRENQAISQFRNSIEQNDLIAMNVNFDELTPSGDGAAQGTPWQTDEYIYEKSLSMDVIGEFVGDPGSQQLIPLSNVIVREYVDGGTPPTFPDGITYPTGNWQ